MRFDRAHPVAHGLVDRVAERPRAGRHGTHLRAQQLHAEDVGLLAADVFLAHVDNAFQAEAGACRGCRDAVLSGAGFGDDAAFTHSQREQCLAERVVDFVCAGMVQVLALQVNLRTAAFF